MKYYLPRIIVILACLILLIYIAIFTVPPKTWIEGSTFQILTIFLSLMIIAWLLVDVFIKNSAKSFVAGLGAMVIFVLQALGQNTLWITIGIALVSILAIRLFPDIKSKEVKEIPKLGLSKEPKKSKLSRLRRHKQ